MQFLSLLPPRHNSGCGIYLFWPLCLKSIATVKSEFEYCLVIDLFDEGLWRAFVSVSVCECQHTHLSPSVVKRCAHSCILQRQFAVVTNFRMSRPISHRQIYQ
jgi:hypothetical protein